MAAKVNPIPPGYHTATPYIVVDDAAKELEFLAQALGANELHRTLRPDGNVAHAEVQLGDSRIMVGGAMAQYKSMPCCIYLYVPDCDALYSRAMKAGAESLSAPADQFYGDRNAGIKDPGGNNWYISTHVEDVSIEEMERRAAAKFKEMAQGQSGS
jgi:uncharacterized glyoxalase superfamily protein PhnB